MRKSLDVLHRPSRRAGRDTKPIQFGGRVFGGRNLFAFARQFIILTAMQSQKKDAPCEY
jgi:hypothetical protein